MSERHRAIYAKDERGGLQLAASADRWSLHDDFVHLSPHHTTGGRLLRVEAELLPFVDNTNRQALAIVDMQNDFCCPGGWTDRAGLDFERCRQAIPGVRRAIEIARDWGLWVIWIYWHSRADLRNLGAPTLYSFKHKPDQVGVGEDSGKGRVLVEGEWGAEMVDELKAHMRDEDVHVQKVRMNGFQGTHLDQILRTQGINTLFFAGVNTDQCVATTMQEAYFRDYNCVLLEDATATSSPDYCQEATVFNSRQCWGFTTTTDCLANARPFAR